MAGCHSATSRTAPTFLSTVRWGSSLGDCEYICCTAHFCWISGLGHRIDLYPSCGLHINSGQNVLLIIPPRGVRQLYFLSHRLWLHSL